MKKSLGVVLALLALASGCATSYSWKRSVPASMRTVSVPTFANESDLMEIGSLATRQLLREFQREGTFRLVASDDAALEIQGTVKSASTGDKVSSRRTSMRYFAGEMSAAVVVSVIDKRKGKVLINNRTYKPSVTITMGQDTVTAERDASGRLADELARMIVDDVVNLKW